MKKIQRQDAAVTMKPPSGGAITGAARAGQVRIAMARMRSGFGVARSTASRPTGTISAPPAPWTMRASVKETRPVDRPQATDARVKTATAVQNTRRAPKRSAAQPLAGSRSARVNR